MVPHIVSSYTFAWFKGLRIVADDEVTTTRLTVGAWALTDLRIPVVPLIAGSRKSFIGSWMLK